jgi:hypothetical protein
MTCNDCIHSNIDLMADPATNGGMVCRRYPPIAVPVTVPHAGGVSVQIHSVFPPIKDGTRCGEFEAEAKPTVRTDN